MTKEQKEEIFQKIKWLNESANNSNNEALYYAKQLVCEHKEFEVIHLPGDFPICQNCGFEATK